MVKEEKMYDFGIFGEWSESTIKKQIIIELKELNNDGSLHNFIYSKKPVFPKLGKRGITFIEEFVFRAITYTKEYDEWEKQYDIVDEVILQMIKEVEE